MSEEFSAKLKALLEEEPEVLLGGGGATTAGWHKIEAMLRCSKEYQFQHVRGLRVPVHQMPEHFAVGALFHAGRARWFSLRFQADTNAWDKVYQAVQEERERFEIPATMKAEQKAMALLSEYVDHWRKRPHPIPIAAEYLIGPVQLFPGEESSVRTARLDDVSRYPEAGNQLCLGESKTTSTDVGDTINQYTLHGQPMLQAALWAIDPNGAAKYGPVAGVLLDVVKKPSKPGERPKFARQFVPITEHALKWYVQNLRRYLKEAHEMTWDTDAPRNVSSCTRMIGRGRFACPYREICSHGRSASSKFVLRDGSSLLTHKPVEGKQRMPWE